MNGLVRTALGDVNPVSLGRTDYHEHLFQVTPLLPGDELDDEHRSKEEARLLHQAGIDAMVDATPTGLGRDPASIARISSEVGLAIVLTTGAHREAHYPAGHWLRDLGPDRLAHRFTTDLLSAIPARDEAAKGDPARTDDGHPIRAGMLKAGIGYWSITSFERTVLEAVASAHARTGAPVMVHLEHGSAAVEVVELLASLAVAPDRIVLAHIDRNPDPGLHAELAQAGVFLGYDGMARTREWPDSVIVECILRVAQLGGAGQIVLGGDVARRTRYVAYGGMPGLAYLPARFVPRLEAAGGPEMVRALLEDNPARLLAWSGP